MERLTIVIAPARLRQLLRVEDAMPQALDLIRLHGG
jgi:hypothetical protein